MQGINGGLMMSDSIMQSVKRCIVCGRTDGLERHHVFFGNPRRTLSEKYGCWCWLCREHHQGDIGVHGKHGHELDQALKEYAQKMWEVEFGDRDAFIRTFGRSYIH